MLNTITGGSECLIKYGSIKSDTTGIILNEDYSVVGKVLSISRGKVTFSKVWDTSVSPKIFNAAIRYRGRLGTPADTEVETGSYLIFHRVGDFNSPGIVDFEGHSESVNNFSWVGFVSKKT